MTRGNHYAVLGIEPGATLDRVEKAYRYLVELYGDESLATYSLLDAGELRQMRAQLREAYCGQGAFSGFHQFPLITIMEISFNESS